MIIDCLFVPSAFCLSSSSIALSFRNFFKNLKIQYGPKCPFFPTKSFYPSVLVFTSVSTLLVHFLFDLFYLYTSFTLVTILPALPIILVYPQTKFDQFINIHMFSLLPIWYVLLITHNTSFTWFKWFYNYTCFYNFFMFKIITNFTSFSPLKILNILPIYHINQLRVWPVWPVLHA